MPVVSSQSPAFLLSKPQVDLITAIWHHLSSYLAALTIGLILLTLRPYFVYLLLVSLTSVYLEMLDMAQPYEISLQQTKTKDSYYVSNRPIVNQPTSNKIYVTTQGTGNIL